MRNMLVLGCLLVATAAAWGQEPYILAELECGKDGKLRGDIELVLPGSEETDLNDCETRKEIKQQLKGIKLAIGDYPDGFEPVTFSKKYEIEDVDCDDYPDVVFEFNLKKLVCAGLFDESTEYLYVGVYSKEDCKWELTEVVEVPVKIVCDDDDDCEDSKNDCDYNESSNGNGTYDCEKKEKSYDCDNSSNGDSYDCEKEEKSYDCDGSENGNSNGDDGNCEYKKKKKKKKDCDNDNDPA